MSNYEIDYTVDASPVDTSIKDLKVDLHSAISERMMDLKEKYIAMPSTDEDIELYYHRVSNAHLVLNGRRSTLLDLESKADSIEIEALATDIINNDKDYKMQLSYIAYINKRLSKRLDNPDDESVDAAIMLFLNTGGELTEDIVFDIVNL